MYPGGALNNLACRVILKLPMRRNETDNETEKQAMTGKQG